MTDRLLAIWVGTLVWLIGAGIVAYSIFGDGTSLVFGVGCLVVLCGFGITSTGRWGME